MKRISVLFLILSLLLSQPVLAASLEAYRLGPGDVLEISVWGYAELDTVVKVRPDGMISFPLVGELVVNNLVPADVRDMLAFGLAEFIQNPQVSVVVKEFRTIQVQVSGAVKTPGLYRLQPTGKISDAIAAAGGVTVDGNLAEIVVITEAGLPYRVDISGSYGPATEQNRTLQDGAEIIVGELRKVTVLGQIKRPGQVGVKPDDGIFEIMAKAGGPTDRAALDKVRIYRGGDLSVPEAVVAGRSNLLFEGDLNDNPKVQAGDILFIPETTNPNWTKIAAFLSVLAIIKDLAQ